MLIVTQKDLRPDAYHKQIEDITLDDIFLVNIMVLGFVGHVLFVNTITHQTHTIR